MGGSSRAGDRHLVACLGERGALFDEELFAEVGAEWFEVVPGDLGESIATRGVELLGLPVGTLLRIGDAVPEVTGLRREGRRRGAAR